MTISKHERVLVTGGSGFLGSVLVRRLVALGANVFVATRGEMSFDRLQSVQGAYAYHEVDLTDAASVHRAFDEIRPTVVFHLAVYGTSPGQHDGEAMHRMNVVGTQYVLAECERHDIRRIVMAGSWAEYGVSERDGLMSEEDACLPCSEYGVSKLASTKVAADWSLRTGRPVTVLRFFSVYGPGEPEHRLVPILLASARSGIPAHLGNPAIMRDFIHVDDVVDAIIRSAERMSDAHEVLNVGTGRGLSIGDLVGIVRGVFPNMPQPVWSNEPCRPWDVPAAIADTSRMQRTCSWRSMKTVEEAIREMGGLNDFSNNGKQTS
ncbi:MAG: NAD(P)-dependent oxidoreductase [Candidatus Uhrbacteria bacterium]|nr:NAD(P)-dependent oxidoreductase [Candidatus Uhrbacteria bacterium]